jgi:hypothetical protein
VPPAAATAPAVGDARPVADRATLQQPG